MIYHFCEHGASTRPCTTCMIPKTSKEIDQRIMGNMPRKKIKSIPNWDSTEKHSMQTVDGITYIMEHNNLTYVIGSWKKHNGETVP